MTRLRVAVMGAGSVGCYVGGRLSTTCEVTLIARPGIVDAISGRGLTLTDDDGSVASVDPGQIRCSTEASAAMGADVVLLTTKSFDTPSAAAQLAPFLDHTTIVVSLQNGLRNASTIETAISGVFPSRSDRPLVLSGMVPFNVVRTGPTTWTKTMRGEIVVKDHPRVDPLVAAARRAGLATEIDPDMRAVLFAKLLLNLNNALNALSGAPLAAQLRDRDHRLVLAASQEEALAVARAAAVRPTRLTSLPAGTIPSVLRSPNAVFSALARRQLAISPQARSSMSDDLDAGRRTEIGELQGAVSDLGRRYEVATPVNDELVDLVRLAERDGAQRRRWSGAELRQAVLG